MNAWGAAAAGGAAGLIWMGLVWAALWSLTELITRDRSPRSGKDR